jgi:hypothetical protein
MISSSPGDALDLNPGLRRPVRAGRGVDGSGILVQREECVVRHN